MLSQRFHGDQENAKRRCEHAAVLRSPKDVIRSHRTPSPRFWYKSNEVSAMSQKQRCKVFYIKMGSRAIHRSTGAFNVRSLHIPFYTFANVKLIISGCKHDVQIRRNFICIRVLPLLKFAYDTFLQFGILSLFYTTIEKKETSDTWQTNAPWDRSAHSRSTMRE